MAKDHRVRGRAWRWLITLAVFLVFAGTGYQAIYSLRQNNLKMLELRQAVFDADKNDGDVATTLRSLQEFVTKHMNTQLPKLGNEKAVQLKYTYEREVAKEATRVAEARNNLNYEATNYCQVTFASASFEVRSQCVEDYFVSHPIKETPIPQDAYGYDFVSPVWSADKAGLWSLASVFVGLILIFRLLSTFLIRRSVRPEM